MSNRRLFYAFWPDESLRHEVESARAKLFPLAGRPVAVANLHVTVAFLGDVEESRIPRLSELAGPIAPVSIVFDRLQHWSRSRALAAMASQPPPRVHSIAAALWLRLDRLGYAREARPYLPHVTLVRDIRAVRSALPWAPVEWTAYRVHLLESRVISGDVLYTPLA